MHVNHAKLTLTIFTLVAATFLGANAQADEEYGSRLKYKAGEVYYQTPVAEKQASLLGEFLLAVEFFDDVPKTVQLLKVGEQLQVRFVVNPKLVNDADVQQAFTMIGKIVSQSLFAGQPLDVHLTDRYLRTIHVLPIQPA